MMILRQLVVAMALVFGVGVVVGPSAPQARAAKKSKKKKKKKKAKAKKAKRAKRAKRASKADAEAAQAEAEERKAPAQFTWTKRPTDADMDARADEKRDEAIRKLKKLLPTVTDGPQKAELIFRLRPQSRRQIIWSTKPRS